MSTLCYFVERSHSCESDSSHLVSLVAHQQEGHLTFANRDSAFIHTLTLDHNLSFRIIFVLQHVQLYAVFIGQLMFVRKVRYFWIDIHIILYRADDGLLSHIAFLFIFKLCLGGSCDLCREKKMLDCKLNNIFY